MDSAKASSSRSRNEAREKSTEGRGQTKKGRGSDDDGWGGFRNYMQAKKFKLDDQFDKDRQGKSSNIFSGVHIYVNGYTSPSSDELRRVMQAHGGRYEMYLSKTRVTHIVASNLPNSKFKMAKTMPIVKPAWITESVVAGRRLSHVPYLLLGNQSKLQPGLKSFPSISSLHRSSSTASTSSLTEHTEAILLDTTSGQTKCSGQAALSLKCEDDNLIAQTVLESPRCPDRGSVFNQSPLYSKSHSNKLTLDDLHSMEVNCELLDKNAKESSILGGGERKVERDNNGEADNDIVYNSDVGDDDIVYNSDENSTDVFGLEVAKSVATPGNLNPNPLKRSRVYSLRKMKKSGSGSFDSVRSGNGSSCDGFSECLQMDQPLSERAKSIVNASSEDNSSTLIKVSSNQPVLKELKSTSLPIHTHTSASASVSKTASSHHSIPTHKTFSLANRLNCFSSGESPGKGTNVPSKASHSENSLVDETRILFRQTDFESNKPPLWEKTEKTVSVKESIGEDLKTLPSEIASDSLMDHVSKDEKTVPLVINDKTSTSAETAAASHMPPSSSSFSSNTSPNSRAGGVMGKAGDKGFLNEFYSNSRLHHLSTWGAELKAYVAEIQRAGKASFPGREKLRQAHIETALRLGIPDTLDSSRHIASDRVVMHIDMDCFFVSVGLLSRPDLKGKAVAVTHSKGQSGRPNPSSNLAWEQAEWRKKKDGKLKGEKQSSTPHGTDIDEGEIAKGYDFMVPKGSTGAQTFHSMSEIASCSYEARKAGLKNGMFMGRALQLCPDLQTIPYNFVEYNRISKILYDLVASYTHDIEAVSCDEMLIDCTDILTDTGATAMEFASLLRAEMMEKTGCPASTGIGPNILLAKLATRRAKPNGQFEVVSSEARKFIEDQPVSDLPGVGYSMTRKLSRLNVETCGQLQHVPVSTLRREFGPKTGENLYRFSLGQDDRPVKGDKQRKSVSAEVNYGIRFSKESDAFAFLKELSGEVKRRLDAIQVKGRSITLKLMIRRPDAPTETAKFMGHGICNTINKSSNLPVATNDGALIAREVIALYKSQKVIAEDVRGIGIQINKLDSTSNPQTVSNTSGHQSILNFALAKTTAISSSKTNPAQSVVDEAKKEGGSTDSRSHENQQGNTGRRTEAYITAESSLQVSRSKKNSTPSLFSSASTSSSSSSSSSFSAYDRSTSLKKPSTDRQNIPPGGNNSSITLFSSTSSSSSSSRNTSFLDNGHNTRTAGGSEARGDALTTSNCADRSGLPDSGATSNSPVGTSHSLSTIYELSCEDQQKPGSPDLPAQQGPSLLSARQDFSSELSHQGHLAGPSTSRGPDPQPIQDHLLSLSQIDSDILKELPSDIAREVLADLTYHKQKKSNLHNRGNAGLTSEEEQSSSRRDVSSAKAEKSNPALPSLSQLNMSCFEALPEHLQEELRAEYARQEQETAEKTSRNAPDNCFTRLLSPHKDKGRQVRQKGRRGRPPGKKKLSFNGNKIRSVDAPKQIAKVAFAHVPDVIICDDEDENTNDSHYSECYENSRDSMYGNTLDSRPKVDREQKSSREGTSNAARHLPTPASRAALCGAVGLEDVRPLLKEWMSSSPEPQTEDVAMVTDYLALLVEQRNLELLFPLLKLIHRKSLTFRHRRWRDSLKNLVAAVQSLICAIYNASLKL